MDQKKKNSPFEDVSLIIAKISALAEENQRLSFENQSLKSEVQRLQMPSPSPENCGGDADGARIFESIADIAYLAYKMEGLCNDRTPCVADKDGNLMSPEEYLKRLKRHIRDCDSYPNPYKLQRALISLKITVDEYVDFVKAPALMDYYEAKSKWEAKQREKQKQKEEEEQKEETKEGKDE